jgi:hypothetical protein
MGFLFRKKKRAQALAELLENGREKANAEMSKSKYNDYSGKEPHIRIRVRVQPENDAPFEAEMRAGLTQSFLLLPGVRVMVDYDPRKLKDVSLIEQAQAILDRNPQLRKNA